MIPSKALPHSEVLCIPEDLKATGCDQPEGWPRSRVCAQAGMVASAPRAWQLYSTREGNVPRAIITTRNDFVGLIAAHKSLCVCSEGSRVFPLAAESSASSTGV